MAFLVICCWMTLQSFTIIQPEFPDHREKSSDIVLITPSDNCDSYVDISYEYYSEDRGKWINGSSYCQVGKTNYNNAAGNGQIRNVRYTFR